MNGVQPFVYITTCGCVFSQAGLKAVAGATRTPTPPKEGEKDAQDESKEKEGKEEKEEQLALCPQCSTKYSPKTNVRTLNPSPDEEEVMHAAMLLARASEVPTKKSGKKRKNPPTDPSFTSNPTSDEPPSKKDKKAHSASASPAPSLNPKMSAVSREVTASLAMEEAKRKATMSDAVRSLYSSKGPGEDEKDRVKKKSDIERFMTMGSFTRVSRMLFE
jgi:hypothetical protein